jgi:hypothetical protein
MYNTHIVMNVFADKKNTVGTIYDFQRFLVPAKATKYFYDNNPKLIDSFFE